MKRLTLACGDYDRTRALIDGTIRPLGIDLTVLPLEVEEIFFRMMRFAEFDAAELSFGSYLVSLGRAAADGDLDRGRRFVAVPAFPSRAFRHSGIYVNRERGIAAPEDLRGATVGVAEYQLTANIWIRGILQDEHGVEVESVRYRTGGLHTPGRTEKHRIELPDAIDIAPIPDGETLSDLLARGELDAIYSPRTPRCFAEAHPAVGRLFADFPAVEAEYFRRTGIFPVMHLVALRTDVYRRDRWLARSLLDAFGAARAAARRGMAETAALRYMLPWLVAELQRTEEVLGPDYWTYGLSGNEAAISTLVRYTHEQHLIPRRFGAEELFAPETLEVTVV
jgi:4,5-dihydroxyphthalate decarboxylase